MLETIFFVSVILCKVVIACSTILLVFLGLLVFYQKKLIYIPTLNNPTSGEGTVSWDRVAPPEEFGFQKSTVDVQEEKVDLRNISKVPSDAYSFRNVSMKDGVVLKPLFLPFQSLLQKKGKNDSTPASKIATFPLIIFFQANAGNYVRFFY